MRRRGQHPRRARGRRGGRRAEPFAAHLADWEGPWRYAAPDETEELLRGAGFASARCWLEPRPVETDDVRTYYRNIIMGAHLGRLPEELHDPFLDAVLERLDDAARHPLRAAEHRRRRLSARRSTHDG